MLIALKLSCRVLGRPEHEPAPLPDPVLNDLAESSAGMSDIHIGIAGILALIALIALREAGTTQCWDRERQ